MKKLLQQYPEYIKTLNNEEINYLMKQNPQKLEGGRNLTGIKNAILRFRWHKNLNLSNVMLKYFDLISGTCLADTILTAEDINNELVLNNISKNDKKQYKFVIDNDKVLSGIKI